MNIKIFLSSTALICFEYEVGVNIKIYLLCFTGGAETGTLWRLRALKYLTHAQCCTVHMHFLAENLYNAIYMCYTMQYMLTMKALKYLTHAEL